MGRSNRVSKGSCWRFHLQSRIVIDWTDTSGGVFEVYRSSGGLHLTGLEACTSLQAGDVPQRKKLLGDLFIKYTNTEVTVWCGGKEKGKPLAFFRLNARSRRRPIYKSKNWKKLRVGKTIGS